MRPSRQGNGADTRIGLHDPQAPGAPHGMERTMIDHLVPQIAPLAKPAQRATRYGPARYGERGYGYEPIGKGRPGTRVF